MMLCLLRRVCVLTFFATLFFMLSFPLHADLTTARIALQTKQFELALAQAEKLAATHPFDSAMFHLRGALDLSTDRNERITATRLFRQMQAGLTVKISGGLGIAPSSNINKISYSTTHTSINPLIDTLQTIRWTANEPQRSGSGLGSEVG